jgi:hypothetical protein
MDQGVQFRPTHFGILVLLSIGGDCCLAFIEEMLGLEIHVYRCRAQMGTMPLLCVGSWLNVFLQRSGNSSSKTVPVGGYSLQPPHWLLHHPLELLEG